VTGFAAAGGAVTKVITDRGEIRTSIVVDAAGAWSRLVAGLANVRLGAIPTRHQLIITYAIPGVESHHPIARVIDCNVYIRPAEAGLMLGGYEQSTAIRDGGSATGFGMDDLPLDVSVIHPSLRLGPRPVPHFRKIKVNIEGLPTMTADNGTLWGRCRSFVALRSRVVAWVGCRSPPLSADIGRMDSVRETTDRSISAHPRAAWSRQRLRMPFARTAAVNTPVITG
jgi:glycine/D-amino acid oxidase-like deaminating enzyme